MGVDQTPNWLMDHIKKRYKSLDDQSKAKWKIPQIAFGLLNTTSVNCYATKRENKYAIGMSAMIPFCALELVSFFFSNPDFYPELGDSNGDGQALVRLDGVNELPFFQISSNQYKPEIQKEVSEVEAFNIAKALYVGRGQCCHWDPETGKRHNAIEYLTYKKAILDLILPRCPDRRKFCFYFANLITTFLWLHEIAHVSEGHLKIIEEQKGGATFKEFPDGIRLQNFINSPDVISNGLLNAMEEEADQEALLTSIGLILHQEDFFNPSKLKISSYKTIEIFIFFICALFSAFERYERRRCFIPSDSHPRGTARIVGMLATLLSMVEQKDELKVALSKSLDYAKDISHVARYRHLNCIKKGIKNFESIDFDLRRSHFETLIECKGRETGIVRLLCYEFFEECMSIKDSEEIRMPGFLRG